MLVRSAHSLVLAVLFLVLPFSAARGQDLAYFVSGSLTGGEQALRTWDLEDGSIATVGPLDERFEVIAFDIDGRLLGVTHDRDLAEIDPATGQILSQIPLEPRPSIQGVPVLSLFVDSSGTVLLSEQRPALLGGSTRLWRVDRASGMLDLMAEFPLVILHSLAGGPDGLVALGFEEPPGRFIRSFELDVENQVAIPGPQIPDMRAPTPGAYLDAFGRLLTITWQASGPLPPDYYVVAIDLETAAVTWLQGSQNTIARSLAIFDRGPVTTVPALSQLGLLVFGMILAGLALVLFRRRAGDRM